MNCRSRNNLLIEINKPIKGDVGGVDIEVVGLRGWVLGNHFFGLAVEILKGDPAICWKDRIFRVLSLPLRSNGGSSAQLWNSHTIADR